MPDLRLIAGSGRSGTTWVLDALAVANGLRPVFEPLNPYASDMGARYAHRALAPEEHHPELVQFFRDVCAGRRSRLWTQYRRQRRWLIPPPARLQSRDDAARLWKAWQKFLWEAPTLARMSRREVPLVKCIWANLMLGWLAKNLPCRVVLIVRHPGAVIESELRSEWNTKYVVDRLRIDERFGELTRNRYAHLLAGTLDPVQELAVRWIVENQPAIESAASSGITVIHYEHLKAAPGVAWAELCRSLGLAQVPDQDFLRLPSQQAAPDSSANGEVGTGMSKWMSRLSETEKSSIQAILDSVKFSLYSMSYQFPSVGREYAMKEHPTQATP